MFKLLRIFGMKEGEHIPIPHNNNEEPQIRPLILNFLKCLEANPRRFKSSYGLKGDYTRSLTDTLTGDTFYYNIESLQIGNMTTNTIRSIKGLDFSCDELYFLYRESSNIRLKRYLRKLEIENYRSERYSKKLQRKLSNVYK